MMQMLQDAIDEHDEEEVSPRPSHEESGPEPEYLHYVTRTRLMATYRPKSSTGFVGLKNQGGTCYLNSLLQTLFMTPEFRAHLLAWRFSPESRTDRNIPFQLQQLMARMQACDHAAIDTRALTASFGWDHSDSFVQHDVQELNRVLFQAIEEYIEKEAYQPFLGQLYEEEMRDVIQCCTCHTRRFRTDKYQDVALLVKGCRMLEDSLQCFVQEEVLDGIDCDHCGSKQPAKKGLEFQRFPKILTLQLRRFDFDYQTFQRVKVHDPLRIPVLLDVRRWLPEDVPTVADTQYQLLSILLHRGTALGGHYFVYIRDVTTDKWYSFNDETVEEVSLDDVHTCLHLSAPSPDAVDEAAGGPPPGESIIGPLFEGEQRTISGRSDRATPYMLVYRSCALPPPDPATPVSIPDYLQLAIDAENAQGQLLAEQYLKVKDLVELKVFYRCIYYWVIANQNDSLQHLTEQAYEKVSDLKKEGVPLSRLRLRLFNPLTIRRGTSFPGSEGKSLRELGLGAMAVVTFEKRDSEEQEWEDFTCDDIMLRLNRWQEETQNWAWRDHCIRGDATVDDLLRSLAKLYQIEVDQLVVCYKETPTRGRCLTPASPDLRAKRLQGDLNMGDNDNVYVEDIPHCPKDAQGQLLPHAICNIEAVNFWTFHFNKPGAETASEYIVFDSRRSFQDLKAAIGEKLQLPPSEFRLKREKRSQLEAANPMTSIIRHTVVMSGTLLFVEPGRPLSDNDLHLSVYKYSVQGGVEKLELLSKRVVSRDLPLADLRRDLAQETGIPCERLRLREVSGNSVRQALTLRTLRDHFAEGRGNAPQLAAQEVEAPETLTPNDLILRITPYEPAAERCGAANQREIIIDRNATVRQLKRKIGDMYRLEQLTLAKVLNAVLETNPKNVLFDNIGSLATVEQYQDSIITKPPLNLRDNDNLFFKEGDEFTKPGLGNRMKKSKASPDPAVRPPAGGGPGEKALVIRTEFHSPTALPDPPAAPSSPEAPPAALSPKAVLDHLLGLVAGHELGMPFPGPLPTVDFDDTAAEAGDDDRSDMTTTPPEYTDPEYAAGLLERLGEIGNDPGPSEQFDAVLSVVVWDPAACTDMDGLCAICLSGYEAGEDVGVTPCQHAFHPDCFQPWWRQNASCPACLTPLPVELP
eukprot:EG_transcript_1133